MTKDQIKKLSKEITKMAKEDQSARKGDILDLEKVKLVDDKNRLRIKEIIKEHGYISPSIYGKDVASQAFLLIRHFPITEVQSMEEYLNLIKSNPEGIDLRPIASFEDRINVYKNKPQKYGTIVYRPPNSNIWYFREIYDVKKLDKRRKELGLNSLKSYAKEMEDDYGGKFELPSDYKEQL